MATALNTPLVPLKEYLNSSYEHDMEYVDGVLIERGMPTLPHGTLQLLLGLVLGQLCREFGFMMSSEVRVEICENRRYRIPDVLLVPRQPQGTRIVKVAPWAVFEIWSPDDRMPQQTARYREFWDKGVREIIILDPETCTSWRWVGNTLIEGPIDGIRIPDGRTIPFSSIELFQLLRDQFATGESESDSESSSR